MIISCVECLKSYDDKYEICPHCGCERTTKKDVSFFLPEGTVLYGRYVIKSVLGHGGFGITYKAYDMKFDDIVAVKEYFPRVAFRIPGEEQVRLFSGEKKTQFEIGYKRFISEAKLGVKFSKHPNIVTTSDYFEENNTVYIVMEYLGEKTLRSYLEECGGKIGIEESIQIIMGVISAVGELHSNQIIHRDIAPDNIFICSDGKIKLIDFGAACEMNSFDGGNMEKIVKPGFAPPEQYNKTGRQGEWTDIYAIGATLYTMITGEKPMESCDRVAGDIMKKPAEIYSNVYEQLDKTIMKAMSVEPKLRFKTVWELQSALENKKKIDYPEHELNEYYRKRKIRIVSGAVGFVFAFVAVFLLVNYFGSGANLESIEIEKGKISVWIPYDNNNNRYDDFDKIDEYGITADIRYIDSNDYRKTLITAIEKSEIPDVFDASYLSEEEREKYCYDLSLVYNSMNSSSYITPGKMGDKSSEKNYIPTGYNIPVLYCNVSLAEKYGLDISEEICSLEEMNCTEETVSVAIKDDMIDCCLNDFGYEISYNNGKFDFDKELCDIFNNFEITENGKDLFINGECIFYYSDSSEIKYIESGIKGNFNYKIYTTYDISSSPSGHYTEMWAVNLSADENARNRGMMWIYNLLGGTAQNSIYVEGGNGIPLLKNAEELYSEVYWQLEISGNDWKNIKIQGNKYQYDELSEEF